MDAPSLEVFYDATSLVGITWTPSSVPWTPSLWLGHDRFNLLFGVSPTVYM